MNQKFLQKNCNRLMLFVFGFLLTVQFAKAQSGSVLHFDGTDDYLDFPVAMTGDAENQTVEFWVKVSSLPSINTPIFIRGEDGAGGWSNQLVLNTNGTLQMWTCCYPGNPNPISNTTISTNTWYHIACVFDMATGTNSIYINGTLDVVNSPAAGTATLRSSTVGYRFGRNNTAYSFLNMYLDEIRIWNTTRTGSEISSNMNGMSPSYPSNLKVYCKLNEGTANGVNTGISSTLTDETGNGYTGTMVNFAKTGTTSNWVSTTPLTPAATVNGGSSNVTVCNGSFSVQVDFSNLPAYPSNTNYDLFWNGTQYGTFTTLANQSTATAIRTQASITGTGASQFGYRLSSGGSISYVGPTFTVGSTPSAPTGTASQSFCSGNSPTLASITVSGSNIKWYDASSNGNLLSNSTALVDGTHYYASQTVGSCESSSRLDVTVTVNTTPSAPTGSSTFNYNGYSSYTVASLTASGTSIQWYTAATNGTLLSGSTALVSGTHYYAQQTVNGCVSSSRLDVLATRSATRFYVKTSSSGAADGSSWADAASNLQNIINSSVSGDEIWVASGTFYPTRDVNGTVTSGRTATFKLMSGVKLYGSFAGTESLLTERDAAVIAANPTVLSGDIGTLGVNTDNSYHVIIASMLSATSEFNGFTVSDGNANAGGSISVNGEPIYTNQGGGMANSQSSYTISNVIFTNNSSSSNGGAIINNQTNSYSLTFTNCKFINNSTATNGGGAIYSANTVSTITNCYFSGNSGAAIWSFPYGSFTISQSVFVNNTNTGGNGGAIGLRKAHNNLYNCVFAGNSASYGGALYLVNENNESTSSIYHCTFYNNSSTTNGKAFYGPGTEFRNCLFWGNTGTGYTIHGQNLSNAEYTLVESSDYTGLSSANQMRSGDPRFFNTSDLDGTDNIWGTSDDGLNLSCGSDAYNTGYNAYAYYTNTDIVGTSRPQFTTKDLGAYESTTNISGAAAPTASNVTATYDGTLKTGSASVGGGYSITWYTASSSGSVTSAPSGTDAGTYTAYAEASNNTSGCVSSSRTTVTVTINAKALTVSGLTASNRVYDGGTSASVSGTASLVGVVGSEDVSLAGSPTATFATKTVANGKTVSVTGYSLSGTANLSNYSLSQPSLSANITAAPLTVNVSANNKVYTATDAATLSSASLSGVLGLDEVTLGGTVTANFDNKNVGTGKSVSLTGSYTIGGADAANYSLSQPSGLTANITKATLTISVSANNKVYDGLTDATLSTPSLVGILLTDVVTLGGSPVATFADPDVANGISVGLTGLYNISGTDANNYDLTQPSGLTANITQRNLTVTANNKNKVYGVTLSGASGSTAFSSSGLQNGETIGTVTIAYGTGAAATDAVGTYSNEVTASAAVGGTFDINNYNVSYATGNIIVGTAPLTITADNQAKCFGTTFTFAGTEFTSSGLLNSDAVSSVTIVSSGAAAIAGVGGSPYSIVPSAAVGTGLTNYSISYVSGNFTVRANPVASFTIDDADQCLSGNLFTLTNTSTNGTGTINTWSWSTANGTNNTETGVGPHTTSYAAFGNKTVNLTVTDNFGCTNSTAYSNNITVWQMPSASFTINDFDQCLVGNSYTFTNTSTNGSGTINAWLWKTSGATNSTETGVGPTTTAYATSGNKTVNLRVTDSNGCSDSTTVSNNITVWAMPVASFTFNDNTQCFVGNSFTLTNTSTNGSGTINTWNWSTSGASNNSETGVGPHTTAYATHGDYTVNLTVTDDNSCSTSTNYTNNVRVYQHPTASYTVTESSGNTNNDYEICTGATVNFNGSASTYGFGASSLTYQWRRDASNAPGTGNTSALYSPAVYGITNPDQFDYTLIVTDNNGCTSSAFTAPDTTIIYVYPFPVPSFTTPNVGAQGMYGNLSDNGNGGQLLCHGKVIFANTSTIPSGSIVQYRWNYGDGSGTDTVTTADNMKHEFPVNNNINWFDPGFPNTQYTITLIARSDEGCVVTTTGTRDIKNGPDAIIGLEDTVVQSLASNSFLFENNSNNQHPSFITNSKWVWGDGDSTTLTTFVPKVYATAGEYRVHLITYTLTGCTDTAYIDLNILPTPTSSFTSAQNSCSNRNVSFSNTSVLATSYAWNFGDGNSSTSASPTHTYAADGMFIVSLSINGGASTSTDTIYVVTTPVMSSINASYNPCGNGFDFSSSATGYDLTYSWSFTNNVGSGTTSTSTSASRVFATTDSAAVTFTATAHGLCSATSFLGLASVPVATPTPTAGVSVTAADNCSGTRTINNSSTNATDYSVSVDGGSFATVTTFPYDITGLSAGAHSVRLVAHNAGSCPDTATASFNVASVVAAFSGVPATCGTSVAFTTTGSSATYGGLTYSWNFNSGEGSSTSSAPSYTFATSGSKSVQLTVTSAASGCSASTTSSVTASAVVGPTAAFTTATASGTCTNGIAFTNTTSGSGNTYSWDFGDGSTATNTNPTKHYGTSGAFTVTLTAVNGSCSSTATASVNIPSTNGGSAAGFVEANSAYSQPISSNSFNFFNTSTHLGAGYNATYSWDFGDGTTGSNTFVYGKTYASIGTYEVTLTAVSGNGCVSTAKQTVNVTSNATSSFSYTPNVCGNRNVAFTSTATSASTYLWNFGDGQTSNVANPTHTYSADGSYSVTLTVNGNTTSSAQTVTVATTPVLGSITSSMNACSKRYTFGMSATGTALTYAWTFSGGTGTTSTTSSASRSYASSGTQTVDLIVTADGRCSASATQISFTADAAVVAPSAGLSITEAVPNSDTRTVNNTSTNATTYSVSVDGAAFASVSTFPYDITGLSNGSHTVILVASNAGVCPDTATSTFTVSTTTCAAVANFNVSGGLSTQPLATNRFDFFNSTTHTGFGWVTRYAWNFGDGTVDTINTFAYGKTYASAGTYAVTLTATSSVDGCTSTKTVNVTVTPSATASFTSTPNSCSNRTVAFTSTSVSASSYSWDFGDGNTSTSANPSHTYAADGNYTVILTINGTTASSPATVTVATTPTSVVVSNSVSSCGNTYTFSASATGFNKTYAWSFTNLGGSTSGSGSSVTRTYSSSGFDTASVIVTADGRCAATVSTANLAVLATVPTVTAALQVTTSNYCGTSRTINNVGSANADSFMVSVDNGTYTTVSSFPYTISGLSVGTHTVALKAMGSGCDDVETNTFVIGSISASFTSSSSSCGPSVSFTNTSTSTAGALTYDWDFNGESTSTSENPTYSFAASGYKDVTLTVINENGCEATYNNDSVYANAGTGNPVASFTSTMVVNGPCNTGILFNASGSTGSTNFLWSYGDGTVSILSSTSTIFHAYASTGTFSVTLTAYNACGTPSTSTANVVVTATGLPTPEVSFSTDYATQCITGNRYDFFNRTILNGWGWVGTYHWYFGDGTSDLVNTHTYGKTYATPGTYSVKLVGISNLGCSDSSTLNVVVLAPGACTPGKMRDGINGRLYSDNNDLKGGKAATTGVQRNADLSDEVILYPNPNSGDFKLELRDINSKSVSVSIVDMLGREVYTNKYLLNGAKEIDLYDMNLAPGTYNLILTGSDEITARKQFAVIK